MKIYVIGAGGVGGYFGGLLAKAGNDVTFVARGLHFETIQKHGLRVKSVRDGDFKLKPIKVVKDISLIQDPDLVLVCVKTYSNEEVAKALSGFTTTNTNIITFQNGVENDLSLGKFIKKGKIYPGAAYVISASTSPGVIEQTGGLCSLVFGARQGKNTKSLGEIADLMKKSGINASLSENIESDIWKKYILINAFSGMTALTRSTIGEVMTDPVAREVYKDCVQEAVSVAHKMKIELPKDTFDSVIKLSDQTNPKAKSSLLLDVEEKRQTEIETLNGTLVRLAKKVKLEVPVNKTIYAGIKSLS